ncbi:MAG: hypothetical protein IPL73_23035 [Candidatus Obscuribacter sp.]|nr:hypothetical protein [Candidatus Obscuribacter sp.]
MNSALDSLDNVMIAAPCNIGWDNMVGDDRVRLCAGCDKNVYNTSRMTKAEIKELLAVEGKAPCLRIYRRADGTMLTEDCPVGLRRVRDAWQRVAKVAASIWACALTVTSSWAQTVQQTSEEQAPPPSVDSIDVVGLPDFESIKKLQTLQNAKKSATGADRSAMDLFNQAKTAQNNGKPDEADQLFTRATAALEQGAHDPKFVELIYQSYADFLKEQGNVSKASDLLNKLARYKSEHFKIVRPTVIDGGGLDHGRSERRQKTSPTLPEGAPVPDNE